MEILGCDLKNYASNMRTEKVLNKNGIVQVSPQLWEQTAKIIEEIGNLYEQGRLIELPCEDGDEVWYIEDYRGIHSAEIVKGTVEGYSWFRTCGFTLSCVFEKPVMGNFQSYRKEVPFDRFGKTVFLTKKEAEAALKEMR